MSDATIVLFAEGDEDVAAVYLHWGGAENLERLEQFFDADMQNENHDNRFSDPEYLAARFVVWVSGPTGNGVGVADPVRREHTNIRVQCDSDRRPVAEVVSS